LPKNALILSKNLENRLALETLPSDSLASGGLGFCPQTPHYLRRLGASPQTPNLLQQMGKFAPSDKFGISEFFIKMRWDPWRRIHGKTLKG